MIHLGDCVEVMAELPADSIDAIVTDPPYGLGFMGKAWDSQAALASRPPSADETDERYRNVYPRTGKGPKAVAFEAHGYQDWCTAWAREAFRVAKPGAHLLAFGGTRTYHRLASAIEDAGWEIRDCLVWAYASGFPKSLDVSKAIDKAAGAEREVTGRRTLPDPKVSSPHFAAYATGHSVNHEVDDHDRPATAAAAAWDGWGTALKPAWEPIVMARKPLRGTVAANVMLYSTGAIHISATRIGANGSGDEGRDGEASARTFCADCLSILRGDVPGGEALTGKDEGAHLFAGMPVQDDDRGAEQEVPGRLRDAAGLPDRVRRERQASVGAPASDGASVPSSIASERGRPSPEPRQAGQPTREPSGDEEGAARLAPRAGSCENCGRPISPGRWPSNVLLSSPIFDGDTPGVVGGGATGPAGVAVNRNRSGDISFAPSSYGWEGHGTEDVTYGDSGTYSRFFVIPKSSRSDREPVLRGQLESKARVANGPETQKECPECGYRFIGSDGYPTCGHHKFVYVQQVNQPRANSHPTVKPLDLMRHLVRLVTPPGGTVLDCFLGSGTTAIACEMEGFAWVGIEKEAEYVAIAEARLNGVQKGMAL